VTPTTVTLDLAISLEEAGYSDRGWETTFQKSINENTRTWHKDHVDWPTRKRCGMSTLIGSANVDRWCGGRLGLCFTSEYLNHELERDIRGTNARHVAYIRKEARL